MATKPTLEKKTTEKLPRFKATVLPSIRVEQVDGTNFILTEDDGEGSLRHDFQCRSYMNNLQEVQDVVDLLTLYIKECKAAGLVK